MFSAGCDMSLVYWIHDSPGIITLDMDMNLMKMLFDEAIAYRHIQHDEDLLLA